MVVSNISEHTIIKIKLQNLSQEPPASSKTPNKALKDIDVLCTFKTKIENQNSDHGCIKNSDHIKIKIKMPNHSQEPPAATKASNEDLINMDLFEPSKQR